MINLIEKIRLIAVCALLLLPLSAKATSWSMDRSLVLSGSGIRLTILAGSNSELLVIRPDSFTVTVSSGRSFKVAYPGPNPGIFTNDQGLSPCTYVNGDNVLTMTGPLIITVQLTNSTTCSAPVASGGGGGGGGSVSAPTQTTLLAPTTDLIGSLSDVALIDLTDEERNAPITDPSKTGDFIPGEALNATPTINIDKDLLTPVDNPGCFAGSLIKGASSPAVYFCGRGGKRYVFPNEQAFHTWFVDFSAVITIPDASLGSIMIGGNVNYRPGVRMVKIQSDPKVYAVAPGGTLP